MTARFGLQLPATVADIISLDNVRGSARVTIGNGEQTIPTSPHFFRKWMNNQ
jgi:hypothetical protein